MDEFTLSIEIAHSSVRYFERLCDRITQPTTQSTAIRDIDWRVDTVIIITSGLSYRSVAQPRWLLL
ncbi:MAG: hypothetical protein AAFX95_26575 [Cyanobacteria bacterium J06639_16]